MATRRSRGRALERILPPDASARSSSVHGCPWNQQTANQSTQVGGGTTAAAGLAPLTALAGWGGSRGAPSPPPPPPGWRHPTRKGERAAVTGEDAGSVKDARSEWWTRASEKQQTVGVAGTTTECRHPLLRHKKHNAQAWAKVVRMRSNFLAFRTGCSASVLMHTYTEIKGRALRFGSGSLHSCPQGSEGVSVLEGSR